MATALTDIFGSEICVAAQPWIHHRNYTAFPGANGLLGMWMGTRGYPLIISGRLRATGASYAVARATLQTGINALSYLPGWLPGDYSFAGTTYNSIVFDSIRLISDNTGKTFHMTASYVYVDFVCQARSLI